MPTTSTRPYSSTRNAPLPEPGRLLCATKSAAGIRPPMKATSSSMRRNCATSWRSIRRDNHEPMPIANR
jgi:hypothetical protein